jgi:hypothetical protein
MLQLAAYRRQNMPIEKRIQFNLYVDEFQNFATDSFVQMLGEARKFGLSLTLAEQSISRQDKSIVSSILTNVGTLICFRCSSPIDEEILLPLFGPALKAGDLLNLPAYNFYIRIASEDVYPPISGVTVLPDPVNDGETLKQAIELSRENYAINLV